MTRADDKRLDDILATTAEIADIVSRRKDKFDRDVALRRAVERCLEIIGEAAKGPRTHRSYRSQGTATLCTGGWR